MQAGRDAAATLVARKAPPVPSRSSVMPASAPLDRVQDTLPGPLRFIPVQALLVGAGAALAGVLVLSMALLRSDKTIEALEDDTPSADERAQVARATGASGTSGPSTAAPEARKAPTTTELDAARIGGADALRALAQRFPEDPAVLQALAVADARDKKGAAAIDVLRHLLEIAPDRAADKDVQAVLVELANGPPEVAPEAFTLVETKMGAAGPDLLYELRERAGSSKLAKDRAAADLAKPEVLRSASKGLRVAEELRARNVCARKELIPRAAAEGDGRSLSHLRAMLAPKGCGGFAIFRPPPECTCLSGPDHAAVSAAIEAIQKRDGGEH